MEAIGASAQDDLAKHSGSSRIAILGGGGLGGGGVGFAIIPIPREATSVATMMGLLPVLNSFKTQSRSFCCLSPWIAVTSLAIVLHCEGNVETHKAPAIRLDEGIG
jgi:hypothetical protein